MNSAPAHRWWRGGLPMKFILAVELPPGIGSKSCLRGENAAVYSARRGGDTGQDRRERGAMAGLGPGAPVDRRGGTTFLS
jgi:hypothetical protein